MKEKLFLLLLLLCGVLVSCDKNTGLDGENPESGIDSKLEKEGEENSENNGDGDEEYILGGPQPEMVGWLNDGGDINKIFFYCWNIKPNKGYNVHGEDNIHEPRVLEDYSHMELHLDVLKKQLDESEDAEYYRDRHKIWDYCQNKTMFLVKEYKKYREQYIITWPDFYSAYVNGKVTISCDKVLFGKKAGEDLSEHFSVHTPSRCMPVGIESPYLLYNYCDEIPTSMSEFFPKESWIQSLYYLTMPISPKEKYDELTFHITLPIKKEFIRSSIASGADGVDKPMQMIDEVYESDCLIKFNW